MNLSISNIAWDFSEEPAIAELMERLDIRGVDIAPTKIWASPLVVTSEQIADYRDFWHRHHIELVGMQSLLFGQPSLALFGSDADREKLATYLTGIIRLAGQLGIHPLVFGSPKNRLRGDLPYMAAFDIAVPFFQSLAHITLEHQTCLCLEPNPAEYGCDFVLNTQQAVELVQAVNHPGFRLHLDAAILHMNGENFEAALESAFPYLEHFHVSEPQLGQVGAGVVDHTRIAASLRRLGYDRWVAIEMRSGLQKPDAQAVENALVYTATIYG